MKKYIKPQMQIDALENRPLLNIGTVRPNGKDDNQNIFGGEGNSKDKPLDAKDNNREDWDIDW